MRLLFVMLFRLQVLISSSAIGGTSLVSGRMYVIYGAVWNKKRKSGVSGWAKYNQKRAETGFRLDSYRGLVNGTACACSAVVISSASMSTALQTSAALQTCAEVDTRSGFMVEAVKTVSRGTQTETVEGWERASSKSKRDMGVGEHLSGEPFLWRGIFDMP